MKPLSERKKVIMDFETCQNENDVRNLIKKSLDFPEWDDSKPDDLLRMIKGLESYNIYFRGTNLVSEYLSKYIKRIMNIFDKVEDMHNKIRIHEWKVVTIDFTGAKGVLDIHRIISEALDFPEWYGRNLDALWDLLTGYTPSREMHLKGTTEINKYLVPHMEEAIKIFKRAEEKYAVHRIIIE